MLKLQWEDISFFIIRKINKINSFIVKLRSQSIIYSSFIHHKYNDDALTMNFILFFLADPLEIQKIDSTEDFLPDEEIVALKSTFFSFHNRYYHGIETALSISDWIQIDIPWVNVCSVNINRINSLDLKSWIETWVNTKELNDQCEVNLSFSCYDFQK